MAATTAAKKDSDRSVAVIEAVARQLLPLVLERIGSWVRDVRAVTVQCGDLQRTALTSSADDDRDTRLNRLWDVAINEGRLFGIRLDGLWMHVGTPEALVEAERWIESEDVA